MQVTIKLATREGAAHVSGILAGFTLLAERYPDNLRFADVSRSGQQSMMDLQLFGRLLLQRPGGGAGTVPPGGCGVQAQLFGGEEPAVPGRYSRKAAAIGAELLRYLPGLAAGSGAQRKEPPEAVGAFHPLLPEGL